MPEKVGDGREHSDEAKFVQKTSHRARARVVGQSAAGLSVLLGLINNIVGIPLAFSAKMDELDQKVKTLEYKNSCWM